MLRKLGIFSSVAAFVLIVVASCGKQLPTQLTHVDGRASAVVQNSVSGIVFNDGDGNGHQGPGEAGVPGVVIFLLHENGDFITEGPTDGTGHYSFPGLAPGVSYIVGIKPTCPTTTPERVAVTFQGTDLTVNFGMKCPGGGECAACKGKLTAATFRFNGTSTVDVRIMQKGYKPPIFLGTVNPGDVISVVGHDKKGTLGDELQFFVNNKCYAKLKTNCSKSLTLGVTAGNFQLVAATSESGAPLCPSTTTGDLCANHTRPRTLVFTYTGEDCSASHHSQAAGKVVCTGDPAFASPVHIIITDSATEGSGNKLFDGIVTLGDQLTEDAANAGATKVPTNSYAYIYSNDVLVQKIQYHTSCSQPLNVGDQFGSLHLDGFANGFDGGGRQTLAN